MQRPSTEILMPVQLGQGRHASPSDGACLMELASLLAGEPWSDRPACVHPVLAAVARVVNDKVSNEDRARLAALIPIMLDTATSDVDSSARMVLLCTSAALAQAGVNGHPDICCAVESARRAAQSALRPDRPHVHLHRRRAAAHAAMAVAAMAAGKPEDRATLCELLEACVATCQAGHAELSQPPGNEVWSDDRGLVASPVRVAQQALV